MKPIAQLWKHLPGSAQEEEWLKGRFAQPSVQEYYGMQAAIGCKHPGSLANLINMCVQFNRFEVYYGLDTPEKLGRFIATEREHIKEDAIPYMDFAKFGELYAKSKGGAFIENAYAEPDGTLREWYYGGDGGLDALPKENWAVRIKLGSRHCPKGIWIEFPSYDPITGQDSLAMPLGELGVGKLSRCVLLDAQCRFENITDLVEQYDSVEELYRACQNFGYLWDEQGQGSAYFEERWRAAMELEQCDRMDFAMDIATNLNCYDFFPDTDKLEMIGRRMAEMHGIINTDGILAKAFDYGGYAKTQIEEQGLVACSTGYSRRNEQVFYYDFSEEPSTQEMKL